MPKVKTHSSAKKRFKITAKGKIKRFQAKTSHMMRNKTKKQKRNLEGSTMASAPDQRRILRLLGKRK